MNFPEPSALVAQTIASTSLGILAPVVLIALLTAYALYAGRERLVALLLALYPAALIYEAFPYGDQVPQDIRFWFFIALILLVTFTLSNFSSGTFYGSRVRRIAEAGIFATFVGGLFFSLIAYLPGMVNPLHAEVPFTSSPFALFLWLLVPLIVVAMSGRRGLR